MPDSGWEVIRSSFWGTRESDKDKSFLLGDFAAFSRFCSLTHAEQIVIEDEKKPKGHI